MPSQLETESLANVVRLAPLVSIDLIVRRQDDRVLLGRRTHPPARGWWFVPGGRIRKDERLADAIRRLLAEELGWTSEAATRLRGAYEHFYPDNFRGTREFDTHYVVLAYEVLVDLGGHDLPLAQHSEYRWLSVAELLGSADVHRYTQDYFRIDPSG
ncbi:MAG: GDP-mannose mannosyl hydrolase [Chloroflexi bacterium]|nr:GDP-mannose mannosyl hydrolase [Chloroflexota bacterium]